jgi:general secretion pathway protein C
VKENKILYALILSVLLTVLAYFLADTVDAMIRRTLDTAPRFTAPIERDHAFHEPRHELSDYLTILKTGIFGEDKGPSSSPAVESSTYRLIGTIEGDGFSGAVLEDASGPAFYRIDQKLPDGSKIIKVQRDKVTLRRANGTTIELQVVDETKIVGIAKPGVNAAGVRRLSEGKWAVDQQEVTASAENINSLLTQARALPYMEQGKTVGFRISEIVPGSLYEKIGLQNGDVIQKINSQDVDDPAKFFQMYQGLKEERNITIDIVRDGQRQSLNYEIR